MTATPQAGMGAVEHVPMRRAPVLMVSKIKMKPTSTVVESVHPADAEAIRPISRWTTVLAVVLVTCLGKPREAVITSQRAVPAARVYPRAEFWAVTVPRVVRVAALRVTWAPHGIAPLVARGDAGEVGEAGALALTTGAILEILVLLCPVAAVWRIIVPVVETQSAAIWIQLLA